MAFSVCQGFGYYALRSCVHQIYGHAFTDKTAFHSMVVLQIDIALGLVLQKENSRTTRARPNSGRLHFWFVVTLIAHHDVIRTRLEAVYFVTVGFGCMVKVLTTEYY